MQSYTELTTSNRAGLAHNGKRAEHQKWGKSGENVETQCYFAPIENGGQWPENTPKKWTIGPISHFGGIFRPSLPHFRSGRSFHGFPTFFHFGRSARLPLCASPARLQLTTSTTCRWTGAEKFQSKSWVLGAFWRQASHDEDGVAGL